MLEMDTSAAILLLTLKKLCEEFNKEPDVNKAKEIINLLERTPESFIPFIRETILYCVLFHLKNNTCNKDANLVLFKIIQFIISKSTLDKSAIFYEIYYCARNQICQKNNGTELIKEHEELKEAVLCCFKLLIQATSSDIIESFYARSKAALISHGIFICMSIVRFEKSSSLRYLALESMMHLLQVHDQVDTTDLVLRNQIADVIMLILPGVASGLLEVALGSDIQNHKITAMSIKVWARTMVLVMQDMPQEQAVQESPNITDHSICIKTRNPQDLQALQQVLNNAARTSEWYQAVSEKFKIILTELDALTSHSNYKVRYELVIGIGNILMTCTRNVQPCFLIFLEILITLSQDENVQVKASANEALACLEKKCIQDLAMKSILELVEESLYDLLVKLPRIIRTSDDSIQIVWLNRLAGYLKLLGKDVLSRMLLSTAHLQKLLFSLVYISELDCSNISLMEDVTIASFEAANHQQVVVPTFKFLFNSTCVLKLYDILEACGTLIDQNFIIQAILKMMLEMPKFKKELTLILSCVLKVPVNASQGNCVYKQVIEFIVEPDNWYIPTSVTKQVSLQEARCNIVQACLYMETLQAVAKFHPNKEELVLKILYLVIEKAGSSNNLVRSQGVLTLDSIAKSLSLNSIRDLIQVNIDYISHHVILKLRRVERNMGVLDVIELVTNYSTIDFLPHVRCIVEDVLLQSGSCAQACNMQSFLKVFHTFVSCIKRLISKKQETEKCENKCAILDSYNYIGSSILEYKKAKDNFNVLYNDEQFVVDADDVETTASDIEDEKEAQVPYFINMIKDVMKACLVYLPWQDFSVSCLAMSILKEGLTILTNYENILLPIVHELWHPLVNRFSSSNPLLMNHAWQLLCCLAQVSHDFIRSRSLKQVLPAISDFLLASCKTSFKKYQSTTCQVTQLFKLQKEILSSLGRLIKDLKLQEVDTWTILEAAEPYLSSLQNDVLQETCLKLFKEVSEYNPDLVWNKCIDILKQEVDLLPQSDLNNWFYKISDENVTSKNKKNVLLILNFIDKNKK